MMPKPKAHLPSCRSRLRRHGQLRVVTHATGAFTVHKPDGTLVAGPIKDVQSLESYSWEAQWIYDANNQGCQT
jgi:hypothetical protein